MSTRLALLLSIAMLIGLSIYTFGVFGSLPAQIPTHWNIHGEIDGWSSPWTVIWFNLGLYGLLLVFLLIGQWLSPKGYDVDSWRPVFNYIMVFTMGLIGFLHLVELQVGLDPAVQAGRWIVIGILLYIGLIGNLLGKTRKNFWVGIRVPWTLANEEVWNATHRFAGRLMFATGFLGALAVMAGMPPAWAFIALMGSLTLPIIYSLVLYKRLSGNGKAAATLLVAALAACTLRAEPTAREVNFKGAGDFELQGTLLLPDHRASEKVPAVLLLPGSGPTDRNGNQLPYVKTDLLKSIAEGLAKEGVASLRFDKRAAPRYSAKWPTGDALNDFFSWESFVGDAAAALRFLQGQEAVDASKTFVLGHSEGGSIALQLGADLKNEVPKGLILVAAPGRSYGALIREQVAAGLKRQGAPEEITKQYMGFVESAITSLEKNQPLPKDLPAGLAPIFPPYAYRLLRSYVTMDPPSMARAFSGDVLIINGEKDIQVSPDRDAGALEKAFSGRTKGRVELFIVPSASHNLKKVGDADKEPGFEGEVAEGVILRICTWIKKML